MGLRALVRSSRIGTLPSKPTYAVSELMVRAPWHKTGVSRQLHDMLFGGRPEEHAMLLSLR